MYKRQLIIDQYAILQEIAAKHGENVTHIKPHGALNNMACEDLELATTLANTVNEIDKNIMGLKGSFKVLIINDASTIKPKLNLRNIKRLRKIQIITSKKNLGSQKSICVGLKYLKSKKPKIYVIGTGGTISFMGDDRMDYINYSYGNRHLTIEEMLGRVPEIRELADIEGYQLINIGSTDVGPEHWVKLSSHVNKILRSDTGVDGIAITHGTATLEETAYFLHLTVQSELPVVVTGAMRPPSSLGTDADVNLGDAIRVAASPDAIGKGVLTVLNNEIQSARDVTKTNSYRLETFRSNELGFLGYADSDDEVVCYRSPTKSHTLNSEFTVRENTELPRVDIAYAYAGVDGWAINAAVDAGIQGIIAAGLGSGGSPTGYICLLYTSPSPRD